jgi:ribosomal protein S1
MGDKSLTEFSADLELQGTVTRTELYGAFVDVGAEKEGLVHISMLKKGNVKRVEDAVEVGQKVTVWVHRVDPDAGRLELSMIQPVALKWKDIKPGLQFEGKVVRLESFGAFVDIGAERPGLVHVSELSTEYVRKPGDVVSVGESVNVRVLDVDRKKRQIRLSMKPEIEVEEIEEEEPVEELPTAMELAMRQALEEPKSLSGESQTQGHHRNKRKEQEDLLLRTLEQRVRTKSSGNGKQD